MFKLTNDNSIVRLFDNVIIPIDESNRDYREFLRWVEEGGVPEPADAVPELVDTITMAQARLALLHFGVLANVEAAVPSFGQAAQIEWEYRTEVSSNHPLVAAIKQLLNWTDAQLQEMFDYGKTL